MAASPSPLPVTTRRQNISIALIACYYVEEILHGPHMSSAVWTLELPAVSRTAVMCPHFLLRCPGEIGIWLGPGKPARRRCLYSLQRSSVLMTPLNTVSVTPSPPLPKPKLPADAQIPCTERVPSRQASWETLKLAPARKKYAWPAVSALYPEVRCQPALTHAGSCSRQATVSPSPTQAVLRCSIA